MARIAGIDLRLSRVRERARRVSGLGRAVRGLRWTPGLVQLVLEELHVVDEIAAVALGERLDSRQAAPTIAAAVALRHTWRADDFRRITRRLAVERRAAARDRSHTTTHPRTKG